MAMLAFVSMLTMSGCTLQGAAGIVANLDMESGGFTTASGSGLGLFQWVGPRRSRMLSTLGQHWREPSQQLGFMLLELRELGLYDTTCRARDPGVAAQVFMLEFERPASRNPWPRMNRARHIYASAGGR